MKLAKKKITVKVAGKNVSKEIVFGYDETKHTAKSAYEQYESSIAERNKKQLEFDADREAFLLKEKAFKTFMDSIEIGISSLEPYDPDTHDKLLNENTVQK